MCWAGRRVWRHNSGYRWVFVVVLVLKLYIFFIHMYIYIFACMLSFIYGKSGGENIYIWKQQNRTEWRAIGGMTGVVSPTKGQTNQRQALPEGVTWFRSLGHCDCWPGPTPDPHKEAPNVNYQSVFPTGGAVGEIKMILCAHSDSRWVIH